MSKGLDTGSYGTHNVWNDARAVSPVVGVVLMVAITVVLGAVIGQFVLGFGATASDQKPEVAFTFIQHGDGGLTIRHASGEAVDADRLTVLAGGSSVSGVFSGTVTAGESGTVPASELSSGDDVLVVFDTGQGSEFVLGKFQYK